MQEIFNNSYPFELVDPNPLHYKYDFISSGKMEIPKRVSIRFIFDDYFNLGFGNLHINGNGEEEIDDRGKNINVTDGNKILNTVLICSLDFLTKNDGAKIVFFGNTPLKHRLYKMRLFGKIGLLKEFLVIKGATIKDYAINLDRQGYKIIGQIDPDNIEYEQFKISNCEFYSFMTFEILK